MTRPRNRSYHALTVEFHDDAACPCTVHIRSYSATFACAIDTGELEGGEYLLSRKQLDFLAACEDEEIEWNDHLRKDHPEYA